MAAKRNLSLMIKLLISRGAQVDKLDIFKRTPLYFAAKY
jgi:ankyrin repeat protein